MSIDKSLDDLVNYGASRRRGPPLRRSRRAEPYGEDRSEIWSELVERVRSRQRSSFNFVKAWRDICDDWGTGDYDPAKYDVNFLRSTLEELVGVGFEDGAQGHRGSDDHWSDGGRERERPRRDGLGSGSRQLLRRALGRIDSRSQSLNHEKLVEEIKELQRGNAAYSRGWRQFCETYGKGKYDPSIHDVSFLQAALLELGDRDAASTPRRAATGQGEALADCVKQWQRSSLVHTLAWRQYCDERSEEGVYDPSLHDEAFLRRAMTVLDIDAGASKSYPSSHRDRGDRGSQDSHAYPSFKDDNSSLVEEVKAKQQQSTAANEAWRRFCEERGDGNYDPSRHDVSFLRAALDRMSSPGEGRSFWGNSWGGATGGPLTERVKEVQRSSISASKSWREFCEARGDGTFDPAHYDAGFLREWLEKMERN